MSGFYREKILDHYHHPRNQCTLSHPTCMHRADNPLCGDEIDVAAAVKKDVITDVKFHAMGCAISVAGASLISEKVRGMSPADVQKMTEDDMMRILGIPLTPSRIKCAMMGLGSLQQCLKNKN